jgi:replicative DNA helicase
MDKTDIFSRLVSCHSGMPVRTHDEYRTIHARELPAITPAILELQKKSITIVDDLVSLEEIIAEAKRLNSLGKADVVIVDYLQIVENESDNREQAVSDIARKLKNLATKIKVPVIAGSQVNDDGKLRESRAIKQHSNQVIYIKHKDDKSCIFVDKNRRGPRNYQFPITMNGEISKLIET